jgi:hypothetical protein
VQVSLEYSPSSKWQRIASSGTGWTQFRMSFRPRIGQSSRGFSGACRHSLLFPRVEWTCRPAPRDSSASGAVRNVGPGTRANLSRKAHLAAPGDGEQGRRGRCDQERIRQKQVVLVLLVFSAADSRPSIDPGDHHGRGPHTGDCGDRLRQVLGRVQATAPDRSLVTDFPRG